MQVTPRSVFMDSLTVGRECPKHAAIEPPLGTEQTGRHFWHSMICALTGKSPGTVVIYRGRKKEILKFLDEIIK